MGSSSAAGPADLTHAQAERAALADALLEFGPQAPTLCEGWDARRLLGHLLARESRPDIGPGLLLGGPFGRWTDRVERRAGEGDFAGLVQRLRQGPPTFSFFNLPGVDAQANLGEYFVHCEDVRRANGQPPRELPPQRQEVLWKHARGLARMMLRRSPVTIELATPDGQRARVIERAGRAPVVLTGPPAELVLYLFGRTAAAHVQLDGAAEDLRAVRALKLGI